MRNNWMRFSWTLVVLCTIVPGAAQAQDSVYEPETGNSLWGDASDPRHYVSLIGKFGQMSEFTLRTYLNVFEHVRDDFMESMKGDIWRAVETTEEQENKAELFLSYLDELAASFRQVLLGKGDLRRFQRALSDRFGPSSRRGEAMIFFEGVEGEIVLATGDKKHLTPEQAADIRYRAEALNRFLIDLKKVDRIQSDQEVEASLRQWHNYLNRGYSQYPWESFVNRELWSPTWANPPVQQLVVGHPELGLGFSTKKASAAEIDVTLLIHAVGYIHYFGEGDYFAGLSGSLFFNGDHGFGFGPTFHTGCPGLIERFPHLSFGMSWHDVDDDGHFFDDSPFLNVSVDLLRLLQPTEETIAKEMLRR